MTSPGQEFYDRQVALLAENDMDKLVERQYHPDAVLVHYELGAVSGLEALKKHFKSYMEHLGYIKVLSTDMFHEVDDGIFFEATVETAGGIAEVYDAMTFQDGKAIRHFTGLKSFRPKDS